jgi:hypothetical protein
MSDVYISSAHYEVYGKVIVEAMELEVPVIGFYGGSHMELIKNDYNGLHYKSEEELANNIKYLTMNHDKIKLYGKQAHWYYKMKIPSVQNFYNQFGAMLEICKNKKCFQIEANKSFTIPEFALLEANAWIWNNKIYVYGGYSQTSDISDNLYVMDLNDNTILIMAKIPSNCATTHVDPIICENYIFFVSGQVGGGYGNAINTFYMYCLEENMFIKLQNLNFCGYDMKGFICNGKLNLFSGATNDRSTPNDNIYVCNVIDKDSNLLPSMLHKWTISSNKFVGSTHSSFIKCSDNKFCYIDGCQCHACTSEYKDIWHMYIHHQNNKIMDTSFNTVNISSQQFQTSHTHSSCFYYEKLNAVICIGGQLSYDNVYNGIQVYYLDYDMWVNISLNKSLEKIFNKGCCSIVKNDKLYVFGGQLKQKDKFNDMFVIFDIYT